MHNNHFCLIWKSDGISFIQSKRKIKDNFKVVESVICDDHVKSFVKYAYKPKNVQPQITNMIVYDIETYTTKKSVPFFNCI